MQPTHQPARGHFGRLAHKPRGAPTGALARILGATTLSLVLGGCASQPSQPINWRGKTIGVAEYPIGEFNVVKGFADVSNPVNIFFEYGIDDPAVAVRDELLSAIVGRCGAIVSPVPIPTASSHSGTTSKRIHKATDSAALAAGMDVLLRVRWEGAYAGLFHRSVITQMSGSVTDLRTGQRWQLYCRQESDNDQLTLEELLDNKGTRLREVLDRQGQACLKEFEAEVRRICPESVSPRPGAQ